MRKYPALPAVSAAIFVCRINEKLSEQDKWAGERGLQRLRFDPKTVGRDKVFLKEEGDLKILEK